MAVRPLLAQGLRFDAQDSCFAEGTSSFGHASVRFTTVEHENSEEPSAGRLASVKHIYQFQLQGCGPFKHQASYSGQDSD